jgi:serine/threonine protein kinase
LKTLDAWFEQLQAGSLGAASFQKAVQHGLTTGALSAVDLREWLHSLHIRRALPTRILEELHQLLGEPLSVTLNGEAKPCAGGKATPDANVTIPRDSTKAPGRAPVGVGTVLDRRYELVAEIGGGGMGEVFKALDILAQQERDPDCYVAIKILKPSLQTNEDAVRGLQREANRARKISHPNVLRIHQFERDRDNGLYFISMELLEGRSVQSRMDKNVTGEPWAIVGAFVEEACLGLESAHAEGIIHSDIKPNNLLITPRDELKILDFGIAAPMIGSGESRETRKGLRELGFMTPAYASLEMLEGEEPRPSDDVYSLACVTYRWLCGRPPYVSADKPLVALPANKAQGLIPPPIPDLHESQNDALRRALALRQKYRTQTAREFWRSMNVEPRRRYRRAAVIATIAGATFSAAGFYAWRTLMVPVPPSSARIDPATVSLSILCYPANASVFVDGRHVEASTVNVQPGEHEIAAIAPAHYGEVRREDIGTQASERFSLKPLRLPTLDELDHFLKLTGIPALTEANVTSVGEQTLILALRSKWLRQEGRIEDADTLRQDINRLRLLGDTRAAVTSFLIDSVTVEHFRGAERNSLLVSASKAGDAMASLFIAEGYRESLSSAHGVVSQTDPRFRSYCDHLGLAVEQGWADVASGYWQRDGCQ